ncbi:hypothetical protein IAT40_005564 [Kwoniella sp. CBS 6097]
MDRPPPPPPPPGTGDGHVHGPGHSSDEDRCRLLGTTGLVVQALMGVFVILSLVVKRQLERRKRSWRIWMYDVSKQLAGQAVVHGLNVLISDLVASAAHNNPCSLYFLNVLIDTTIGVGIIYFSLKAFTWYFSKYMALDGFVSGQYGHPPRPDYWWKQLAPYLLSIITMKLLVVLPLTLPGISKFLIDASHSMLDYLSPQAQIIFVMAIFPVIMNVFQFCLVDQLIKGGKDVEVDDEDDTGRGGGRGGRTGAGASAGAGAYSRVPDWEGDGDGDGEVGGEGDLESGRLRRNSTRLNKETQIQTQTPRERSRSRPRTRTTTTKTTTSRTASMATPVIPSSPLLSPGDGRDYGSTTPSPIGSPDKPSYLGQSLTSKQGQGQGQGQNIWTTIMSKLSDTSASASASASASSSNYASATESRSHSVIFDSSTAEETRSSTSNNLTGESGGSVSDRLYVRDGRGKRSAAPSPDSIRPISPSFSPSPISSTMYHQPEPRGGSQESGSGSELGSGSGKSEEAAAAGYNAPGIEGLSRHLPEGLEREARWTLSPPESPTVSDGRDTVDSVGLREVHVQTQTRLRPQGV